ncbi:ABC transporter permease [Pandoraea terrae]|uniref:ABC transporter permease n=1 Tax=Pandoraea terrae TaxID=1537710 RepID=A0A5E4RSQ8_9BURK|nr:ABC transporter permease [Pandoraea terrae]VVD66075.1 ABC transporter permease [Pandoraea terrae]
MSAQLQVRLPRARLVVAPALLAIVLSVAAGLAITALLLVVTGYHPTTALMSLLAGAFGGKQETAETVARAVPLALTALGTAVAYRARLWSVGQEGQLVIGALFTYATAQWLGGRFGPLAWGLPLIAGAVGGALWGVLPAWWKARRGVSEIISTVLLNYVAVYVLMYVIAHICAKTQSTYLQSDPVPVGAWLPTLVTDTPLNIGVFAALIATAIVGVVLAFSAFGFELRAFGSNPQASRFKGIHSGRMILAVFAISGALCGLCGGVQLLGTHQRLSLAVVSGAGYAGVIVAMLARLNPCGVLLAALLFGALDTGSTVMQLEAGVPSSLARAMQALMLICFLVSELVVRRFYVNRERHD